MKPRSLNLKRLGRFGGRLLAALMATVLLLAIALLDTVDYQPYFKAPYYADTSARWKEIAATNAVVAGELSAGFGRSRLNPTVNAPVENAAKGEFTAIPLAGFGNRNGRPAMGSHDDLHVKAVALRVQNRTAVMFGIDALIVPREISDAAAARLGQEFGLRREDLYFSATHTHCSLGGWGEGFVGHAFAGGFNPGSRVWFVECIVQATRAALADLQPAAIGQGSFAAREFVRNRVVGELGAVDPEFSFAILKQASGRTGVLGSFSAHATVLGAEMMEFSGDYPGRWQAAMEQNVGFAMFLAGAVGSHAPVPGARGLEGVQRMGDALAGLAKKQLAETLLTNSIAFGILGLKVALPPLNVRLTDGLRLRPWAGSLLIPKMDGTFLQGLRLGQSVWISTPCDYSGELALEYKDFMRARGFRGIVTSFNGDYVGYVIPARYYHLGGYEPQMMSFYGPYVPDYLNEFIRAISLRLISGPPLSN